MKASFSVGRWTLMTFLGWLLGVFLIVLFSGITDFFGLNEYQFVVGTGMATGVCLIQWLYLKRVFPISINWMFAGLCGMTIPFLVVDLILPHTFRYALILSTASGSVLYSFLQYFQLRKHFSGALIWVPVTAVGWMASVGLLWLINSTMSWNKSGILVFFVVIVNLILILGGGAIVGIIQGIAWKWIQKTTYPKRQSTF